MVEQNQRKYDLPSNTQVKAALELVIALLIFALIYYLHVPIIFWKVCHLSMRFKLLIARVISNSCITSTYFYILGEGNECGHRVRQIWRRGPRQYWPYEGGECPYGIHRAEKDHMFFLCYYTPEKQNSTSVTGMKNKKKPFSHSVLQLCDGCDSCTTRELCQKTAK